MEKGSDCAVDMVFGVVARLMLAGAHDRFSIFSYVEPVCRALGLKGVDCVRLPSDHCHTGAFVFTHMIKDPLDSVFVQGLYCLLSHNEDYPGFLLYDVGFCISSIPDASFDVLRFQRLLDKELGFSVKKLGCLGRCKLRFLSSVVTAFTKNIITYKDLEDIGKRIPDYMESARTKCLSLWRRPTDYHRARNFVLSAVRDCSARTLIDNITKEQCAAAVMSLDIVKEKLSSDVWYLIAWECLSEPNRML